MNEKKNFIDKIMEKPSMAKYAPAYIKHREFIMYSFFGILAFFVCMATYAYCNVTLGINELLANAYSWIVAVLFSFVTNKIWVFDAPTRTFWKLMIQMLGFFSGRVVTLIVEEAILFIFITMYGFPSIIVKLISQFIVVTLNYVISKLVVFRKK